MKKKSALILGLILLLVGGVAYAELPPRVSWTPGQLKPVSIAPGGSASYNFTLTHTGILPVLFTHQLRVVAEGSIVPYVTITQPKFPSVFKKGNQATLSVKVMVSTTTPLSVKDGQLVLKRFITVKVGKGTKEIVTDVWRADALPVELTFSTIPLPADPDKTTDEATILGVDIGGPAGAPNGVPDRIDRWIGFTAPESEKKRAAMTLGAKAQQDFFKDYLAHLGEDPNDPAVVARVLAADTRIKAGHCSMYAFGVRPGFSIDDAPWKTYRKNSEELDALFMDTPDRIRAFWKSEKPLVATGGPNVQPEQFRQECLDLGLDLDALPN